MFNLKSKFSPAGDQAQAITKLTKGLKTGLNAQTLLGVTGSGKTFTIASVINEVKKPTLIISHNKTLAAQLYQEFKEFFPHNSVHYFVSYYDYYQPEAYLPTSHTYIEKDAKINQEIDRLRHAATQALLSRDDVIIVASASCIYNLGSPEEYGKMSMEIFQGQKITPSELHANLLRLQYAPDIEMDRGKFRHTPEEFEIIPSTGDELIKIRIANNKIQKIKVARNLDLENKDFSDLEFTTVVQSRIFPAKYWVSDQSKMGIALQNIRAEMDKQTLWLRQKGMVEEAARLRDRTEFDIAMIRQTDYCYGIENYSRHLEFRQPGEAPYTLIDFFGTKPDFLTIVDESHMTIPQLRGMYSGDSSRKSTLVKHGFRLPSALDNRPLRFPEFNKRIKQTIYVSATPNEYELKKSGKKGLVEQLVRPTGLLDPTIEIVKTEKQVEHLIGEIKNRVAQNQRVLVTTITKRMAEDMAEYLSAQGIKVNYLHSEIKTLQRVEILRDLRIGKYDVIVGVNLLREGLDLPEVSLIAILDADKEGFLRNATTLIQTMGRAARHLRGHVIMYADKETKSMKSAIAETKRRRTVQEKHNTKHKITPIGISKSINDGSLLDSLKAKANSKSAWSHLPETLSPTTKIKELEKRIEKEIKRLNFETAIALRDEIRELKNQMANAKWLIND